METAIFDLFIYFNKVYSHLKIKKSVREKAIQLIKLNPMRNYRLPTRSRRSYLRFEKYFPFGKIKTFRKDQNSRNYESSNGRDQWK